MRSVFVFRRCQKRAMLNAPSQSIVVANVLIYRNRSRRPVLLNEAEARSLVEGFDVFPDTVDRVNERLGQRALLQDVEIL